MACESYHRSLTRRDFFGQSARGLGVAALASLLGESLRGDTRAAVALDKLLPHFAPTAKRVIYLFMFDDPAGIEPRLNNFQANLKATKGDIAAIAVESSVNLGSKDPMSPKRIVELTKLSKKADYTFSIALGLKKRPPGYDHGLPYCYVLDSKKVIIYKGPGQGEEFDAALSKAAAKAETPDDKPKDAKKEDKSKPEPKKAA